MVRSNFYLWGPPPRILRGWVPKSMLFARSTLWGQDQLQKKNDLNEFYQIVFVFRDFAFVFSAAFLDTLTRQRARLLSIAVVSEAGFVWGRTRPLRIHLKFAWEKAVPLDEAFPIKILVHKKYIYIILYIHKNPTDWKCQKTFTKDIFVSKHFASLMKKLERFCYHLHSCRFKRCLPYKW